MPELIDSNKILSSIEELFTQEKFTKNIRQRLRDLDRHGYEEEVKGQLQNLLEKFSDIAEEIGHLASSLQYESAIFGRWIRFRLCQNGLYEPGHTIRHTEADYFEELHELMPEQANLLFAEDLKDVVIVQFGGNKPEKNKKILFIEENLWKTLQEEIKNNMKNPRKFILGEIEDYQLKESLSTSLIEPFKSLIPPRYSEQTDLELFKIFLFTFYYTIIQEINSRSIYHVIIPFSVGGERLASYCGAFEKSVDEHIDTIRRLYSDIVSRLYTLECLTLRELEEVRMVVRENIIRLCSFVPDTIPEELNQFKKKIDGFRQRGQLCKSDQTLDSIALRLGSASPKFLGLIDDMARNIGANEKKITPLNVFFHSEPGLGKESLGQLCHYFSLRSRMKQEDIEKKIEENFDKLPSQYRKTYKEWLKSRGFIVKKGRKQIGIKKDLWDRSKKEFSFLADSIGSMRYDNYGNILFGDGENPGIMTRAHLLTGSIFLDEVNTMDKQLTGGLLRAIQAPFSVRPERARETINLNLLAIFAANMSPEQLRTEGFNSAFIDRITQISFRVTPLRERRTDIPVIFNHLVRRKNAELENKIRFIDLNGLRLMVELKWKKNVRDLENLVDDLFAERSKRNIAARERNRITFKEIIKCVVRRELI